MKVGFESGILGGRRTGIGNYCFHILRSIKSLDTNLHFLSAGIFGWQEVHTSHFSTDTQSQIAGRPARIAKLLRDAIAKFPVAQRAYQVTRKASLRRAYSSPGISLFHAFNFVPIVDPVVPTLPVVYDLSFIRYPQFHPASRVRALSKLPQVIERAPLVHTISEFTKCEIVRIFNYPAERIFVAYPAAAPIFRDVGEQRTSSQLEPVGLLWKKYLLAVGTLEPRKNLAMLVDAYLQIPSRVRANFPLIIVGGAGWGEQKFPARIERLITAGAIRFLGYVPDKQLRDLYEGARLMLYPSVYEGFGMPVVEAMACGTAVLHSANSSMDEISGDLTGLVASDIDAWTRSMTAAIQNESDTGSAARILRAKSFNWDQSAKIVRSGYDEALKRS